MACKDPHEIKLKHLSRSDVAGQSLEWKSEFKKKKKIGNRKSEVGRWKSKVGRPSSPFVLVQSNPSVFSAAYMKFEA